MVNPHFPLKGVAIPILSMNTLKIGEESARGLPASKWQNWDWNLFLNAESSD